MMTVYFIVYKNYFILPTVSFLSCMELEPYLVQGGRLIFRRA